MSNIVKPVITKAGLTSVFEAHAAKLQLELTHVALGDGAYVPDDLATALVNERQRVPIAGGEIQGGNQLHVTALADGEVEFWVSEVGFYAGDQLFAVYSHPENKIAWKSASLKLLMALDLSLEAVPADVVTINVTGEDNYNLSVAEPILNSAANHFFTLLHLLKLKHRIA